MKLNTIENTFDLQLNYKAYTQMMPLHDALSLICNGPSMMSKRLSEPMTFHNARIFTLEGDYLFHGDIHLPSCYRNLAKVAAFYGKTLCLLQESGQDILWTSVTPDIFYGWCMVGNEEYNAESNSNPTIFEALPMFRKQAKRQQRQWLVDHGLARRTPLEWWKDTWYYIKCNFRNRWK